MDCEFNKSLTIKSEKLDIYDEELFFPYATDNKETVWKIQNDLNTIDIKHELEDQSEDKAFKCPHCFQFFQSKKKLSAHIGSDHSLNIYSKQRNERKSHECDICHKSYTKSINLTEHKYTHTGERPYECNICHKRFIRRSNHYKHKATHVGKKPFECAICNTRFTEKYNLRNHLKRHSGVKPHQCEVCGRRFFRLGDLKLHRQSHDRFYKCEMCPKRYATARTLKRHLKSHSDVQEKTFECDVCHNQYKSKTARTRHMALHAGDNPYQSELCPKQYAVKHELKYHLKTHTIFNIFII